MTFKNENKFNVEEYFNKKKKIVETALNNFLPQESIYPESIHKAMRYSVFAGGKRLRAVLMIAASEIFSPADNESILPVACAVEMIHTYSLIHDDLPCIDNDDLRRGKPTSHKVFGEAIAVLAGDALLTHAFLVISQAQGIKPEILIRVIQVISNAISTFGMIGGQVVDIETSGKKINSETLEYIHIHKTASLLHSCVYTGALIGGANFEELECISNYGKNIGLAFQIVDDILDIEGDVALLGKSIGSDLVNQKNTYPGIFGMDKSKELKNKLINEAINEVEKFGAKADALKTIACFIRDRNF